MLCREAKLSLSPYLDGQLDSAQARSLEEHFSICPPCKHHLELMEEIPVALQTDRMLDPRPEFTTLVMQKIIVRQQLGTGTLETSYSRYSFRSGPITSGGEAEDEEDGDQTSEINSRIISFEEQRARRTRTPADLVLRFSSLAAAIVMMVGVGVYVLTQASGNPANAPTASVYGAIQGFADTLRSALSSPLEIVAGVAIAAAFLIGLWYFVKTLRATEEVPAETSQPERRRA